MVAIYFHDHCHGNDILDCKTIGWVHTNSRMKIVLDSWAPLDDNEDDCDGFNRQQWTILKSTIIKLVKLVPEEQIKEKNVEPKTEPEQQLPEAGNTVS